jgi:hypothetical protein
MNRKVIQRVLIGLIAIIAIASVICYLVLPPWKAFYLACCGGVIIINLLISLFFVSKNIKK